MWAVIGGVLKDTLSIAPLGTSALGMVIVVFVADSLFGTVRRNNLVVPPLVVAVRDRDLSPGDSGGFADGGVWSAHWRQGYLYVTLPTMVYNLILILPVFRAVGSDSPMVDAPAGAVGVIPATELQAYRKVKC